MRRDVTQGNGWSSDGMEGDGMERKRRGEKGSYESSMSQLLLLLPLVLLFDIFFLFGFCFFFFLFVAPLIARAYTYYSCCLVFFLDVGSMRADVLFLM